MNRNEKAYEQLIKLGAKSDPSQVKDILTDDEVLEMGYSLPPEDMLDKIKKACAEETPAENPQNTVQKSKKHVSIRKIIILAAALVLIILLGLGVIYTTGVNQYEPNSRDRVEDNAIRMSGSNNATYTRTPEENTVYEKAEQKLGTTLLKPTYLPEGFKFDKIKFNESTNVIISYKNQNNSIKLAQSVLENSYTTNESIDATNKEVYSITAHNSTITVREHTQKETDAVWLSATWYGNGLMCRVDSNCSREEFNKFIENLE